MEYDNLAYKVNISFEIRPIIILSRLVIKEFAMYLIENLLYIPKIFKENFIDDVEKRNIIDKKSKKLNNKTKL